MMRICLSTLSGSWFVQAAERHVLYTHHIFCHAQGSGLYGFIIYSGRDEG
jgi:hypothetical protein